MFTRIMLGFAGRLAATAQTPGSGVSQPDLIGEEKIKSVSQFAMGLNQILKKIVGPILSAIGIAAVLYAIYLGVMYAKAESADKRKEVQGRLIGAIIGAVIIVVATTLCFALNWAQIYWSFTGEKHDYVSEDNDNYCDWCGGVAGGNLHK